MIPLKMSQNSKVIFSKMSGILTTTTTQDLASMRQQWSTLSVHSFKKFILIAYYVPSIKLGFGNTAANKTVNNTVKHGTDNNSIMRESRHF